MNRDVFELAHTDGLMPSAEAQKFLPVNSFDWNEFTFFILPPVRHSPYHLVVRFKYPEGTFSGSTAQPTQLPSKASVLVFPQYDFPKTMGELGFEGEVQTTIEKMI